MFVHEHQERMGHESLILLVLLATAWSCGGEALRPAPQRRDVWPITERRRERAAACLHDARDEIRSLAYGDYRNRSVSIAYAQWASAR